MYILTRSRILEQQIGQVFTEEHSLHVAIWPQGRKTMQTSRSQQILQAFSSFSFFSCSSTFVAMKTDRKKTSKTEDTHPEDTLATSDRASLI